MKEFRKFYLPCTSMIYMFIVVSVTIINLLKGNDTGGHNVWLLQLLLYLIVVQIINYLLSKLNFKSYLHYYTVEYTIYYFIFIIVTYYFKWFDFNMSNLMIYSILFIINCGVTHYHFYKLYKDEADNINKELSKRNKKI